MDTVVTKHKDSTTYEEFISRVYSPIATRSPFCSIGTTSSGAGDGPSCTGNPSMLAAALLDSHGHSHKTSQRNEEKFRGTILNNNRMTVLFIYLFSLVSDLPRGVWFNNTDVSQNVESTSISPRPLKKLSTSLKGVPRKSLRHEISLESPPDSPPQVMKRK